MPTDPLLSLKEKAEAATRGNWTAYITNRRSPEVYTDGVTPNTPNPLIAGKVLRKNDAAFISTFNPKVAIALVDALIETREGLTKIAEGTEDTGPPYRALWAPEMQDIAKTLLQKLNTLGDGHVG